MSLSKRKYIFLRKKTENKENLYNTEIYLENINDNNKNNQTTKNPEISLNDLICQTSYSEKLDKEIIKSNPLTESQIRDENIDIKNEESELTNNSKLLYLIRQNKSENIDFINTLLKLKGIQAYSTINDKSSNNIISQKYDDKNNSTLISKAKTISGNYPRNDNEEEILKKINNSVYSINDLNYNLENTNKTFNKYTNINTNNLMKIDSNIFQKERMTIDYEKENNNFFLYHANKDTISSIECNTNNSTKKNIRKNDVELVNTRECILNITNPENYNKTLRRGLIPIIKDSKYKTLYASNIRSKNTNNYRKVKSIIKKKAILDPFKGNKIYKEKSRKKINYIQKFNFEINNTSKNNSKEPKLKNHYSTINEINLRISENSKKNYNKKNNIKKNKISLNKKISNNRNNSFIKKNNKNDIINKSTNYIFHKSNKIFHENHYKSNIDEYKSEKTKIFENKIKKEKIKKIQTKELLKNPKQIKKSKTKHTIIRNLNKDNMLKDNLPFNTERKKKSKIFSIRNIYSDKLKISLNKSNNFSSYIKSKNENNNFISKNLNLSNANSYKKISKPKNSINTLFRNKNKKFPIRTNLFNESIFRYNKFNISCNNSIMSFNSMKNKGFGLNSTINKKKKIFNKKSKNKNKINITMKDKNKLRLMNELKGEKKSEIEKKFNEEDKIISYKEFNNSEIQEIKIKILNKNEICQNNSIYKKENNIKRAEIFLFDNDAQIQVNNNEEK